MMNESGEDGGLGLAQADLGPEGSGMRAVCVAPALACSLASRLRGLLGRRPPGPPLALAPCSDVHTFGMSAPVDLAFVNGEARVVAAFRAVEPSHRVRVPGSRLVVERFAQPGAPWFEEGDLLVLGAASTCAPPFKGR